MILSRDGHEPQFGDSAQFVTVLTQLCFSGTALSCLPCILTQCDMQVLSDRKKEYHARQRDVE